MEELAPVPEPAAAADARLQATWAGARDGLWDWDSAADRARFSPRWKALLGYAEGELSDRMEEWFLRVHAQDLAELRRKLAACLEGESGAFEHELRVIHRSGGWRWMMCRAARLPGSPVVGGSLTDVTALKMAENRLLIETSHDRLTGLPNESLFLDRLALALVRSSRRPEQSVAVLYLDLDRFHTVNDSFGVAAGDELLVEIATRLTGLLRLGDTLARIGADKFALLLDAVHGPAEAVEFAHDVGRMLRRPLRLGGHEIFAQGSLGIALARSPAERPEHLLRDALTAMHRAKRDGSVCEVFDPEMNHQAKQRLRLEADLHHALERGEFVLHYQPVVSLAEGHLSGFEALVRWVHPTRGLVPPGHFIPVAEDTGLIERLGDWVLRDACAQFVRWQAENLPLEHVSVNVSPRQFHRRGFAETVATTLRSSGMPAECLQLEITESVLVDRAGAADATLAQLVRLGIRLSLDDFGTGYSSLSYLQHLPVSEIKLDRSFILDIVGSEDARAIARSILAMVQALRKDVVAEGVETLEQLALLARWGCDSIQGYYIARPLPGKEFEQLVREWVAPEAIGRSLQQVRPIAAGARG
jgi:diguanylate cyclase (GGDEF)-like protein/PAS domain S-box-containing protein